MFLFSMLLRKRLRLVTIAEKSETLFSYPQIPETSQSADNFLFVTNADNTMPIVIQSIDL